MLLVRDAYYWLKGPHATDTSIDEMRWNCRSKSDIGVDEFPEWQDWSERETTPDQQRIEAVLDSQDLCGKRLFHVGIGNSGLARKFHDRLECIDGITIQSSEVKKAISLNLPRYRVLQISKFSPYLAKALDTKYHFIVDNNPSAFACCRMHFFVMMRNYRRTLVAGGIILTDKLGLGWSTQPNDQRWRMSPDHWFRIGLTFGFDGINYDDWVIGLRKRA